MSKCEHYDLDCEQEERGCEGCAYYEKSADDMFKEMGFIKTRDNLDCWCIYENPLQKISFEKSERYIFLEDKNDDVVLLNFYQLQAINKKGEELGWK